MKDEIKNEDEGRKEAKPMAAEEQFGAVKAAAADASNRSGRRSLSENDDASDRQEEEVFVQMKYTHMPVRHSLMHRYGIEPVADQFS